MVDTVEDYVYEIDSVSYKLDMLKRERDALVQLGRSRGMTWQQIGDATHMTKQAAHERWGNTARAGRLSSVQVEELFRDL